MTPRRSLPAFLAALLLATGFAPFAAASGEADLRVEFRSTGDAFAGSTVWTFVTLWNEGASPHEVLVGAWADGPGFEVTVSPSRLTVPAGMGMMVQVRVQVPEETPGGSYALHVAAQGRHGDLAEAEGVTVFGVYGREPCCEPAPEPCCAPPTPCCEEPCCAQPPPCCAEPCCAQPPTPTPCCPEPCCPRPTPTTPPASPPQPCCQVRPEARPAPVSPTTWASTPPPTFAPVVLDPEPPVASWVPSLLQAWAWLSFFAVLIHA